MNIYLVKRTETANYDEYAGFVVIEQSEENVLEVIKKRIGYFYDRYKGQFNIKKIGETSNGIVQRGIVLSDYRAG